MRIVVSLTTAALLLIAVDVAPTPAQGHVDGPPAGIQELLDRREAAVTSGDENAFLATVDPQASAAFREAQRTLFAGLRSVPLEKYELEARTDDTGDLGPAAAAAYPGATVSLPETRQVMRVRGYDQSDAIDSLWLTYVQRDRQWYVGGDSDVADIGLETARGVWDGGPVATVTSERFIVLTHPGHEARARAILGAAEQAAARLDTVWDRPWSKRIPIVLPASIEELERILQTSLDLNKFVAFVGYGSLRDDGFENTAPRMYIQDRNLSRYPAAAQVETLVHELAHAAHVPLNGPFIPYWVHEGVADWLANGRPTGERRAGGDASLPRDHEFAAGSSASILRAYREARSAVSTLSRVSGVPAVAGLFADLGAVRVEAGDSDYHVDAALRRVVGYGVPDLEARWTR